MTDIQDLTAPMIMSMGYKRIKSIADRHGINSPEVLSACERWGGILDDVNYPDSTCRWCGVAVTHAWEGQKPGEGAWYHVDSKSKYCWPDAPAAATPVQRKTKLAWRPDDQANLDRYHESERNLNQQESNFQKTFKHPDARPTPKPRTPRKLKDNPQA